jgi:amidohydrolase
MHACGHDGHVAMLLTTAKILNTHRKEFAGTLKFIFQPAEEGLGGAERMISEGVLENPRPALSLAMHLWNEKPLGWVGISNGPALAGAEIFKIKIRGKGGHGAAPHLSIDPILAASQIVNALQSIVSRNIEPLKSAVISICTFHSGEAFNVIPQEAELTGTIRTFEPLVREKILERFEIITYGLAETMGCRADIDLKRLTPSVINQKETSVRIQELARTLLPEADVDEGDHITMGSEDMAFIMEEVPGCFFFIGSANKEKGLDAGHHHPCFDFDEQAMVNGTALMTATVMDFLKS